MSSSRNRAGVKRRIRDIATHVLEPLGVQVAYTWPGDEIHDSALYLGLVEGETIRETIGWGAHVSIDRFSIDGQVRILGCRDGEEAEEAAEAVIRALDDTLRPLKRLRGVPGLDNGDTAAYRGLTTAAIGQVDGPAHSFPHAGQVEGFAAFSIDCTTTLHS